MSPETGFSYQVMFIDHMEDELAKVESKLVESEDRHLRQLARISQLRRRRDEGVAETYDKQTANRVPWQSYVARLGGESWSHLKSVLERIRGA